MAIRSLVTVGSFGFPEPSYYDANTATLVDSGRNLKGKVIGAVVRDDVSKVEIGWRYLTVEQWANINKCFSESNGGKFYNTVTFFDQTQGGWVTKEMYVGDRKAGMWRRNPDDGEIMGWTECKLSLIEV